MKKLYLLITVLALLATPAAAQVTPVSRAASLTTTVCPGAGCIVTGVNGLGAFGMQVTGTFVGTLTVTASIDGSNFAAFPMAPIGGGSATSTMTSTGQWTQSAGGYAYVKIAFTAWTSGTAVVTRTTATAGGPISASITGGDASASNQTSGTQKTQIVDGSGNVIASTSNALNVAVTSGGSGTTDTDDGTVAGGQSTGLGISLNQVWDGSNWKRQTIGTAGTAAAQVTTVQGIASGTPISVACSSGCTGGTTDTDDGTIAGAQSTGLTLALGQVWDGANWKRMTIGTAGTASAQVLTVQGVASMTALTVAGAKTNNNAAPGATNVGVLPCQANASVQSWTEGNLVNCSTDLSGRQRVLADINNGSSTSADNGVSGSAKAQTLPGLANAADPTLTEGRTNAVSLDLAGNTRVKVNVALPAGSAVIGALVANQSVNVAQINGVTTLMGNGGTGTGSQRVTIANDNTVLPAVGAGATGSAVPANAVFTAAKDNSGNTIGDIACTQSKIYDASTNGNTELVAISGSTNIFVCGYELFAAGTVNVSLVAGTGTACASAISGTPSTGTSGAAAALTPAWQFTTQTGKLSAFPTHGYLIATGTGNALCLKTSAGQAVQAQVWYAQR